MATQIVMFCVPVILEIYTIMENIYNIIFLEQNILPNMSEYHDKKGEECHPENKSAVFRASFKSGPTLHFGPVLQKELIGKRSGEAGVGGVTFSNVGNKTISLYYTLQLSIEPIPAGKIKRNVKFAAFWCVCFFSFFTKNKGTC